MFSVFVLVAISLWVTAELRRLDISTFNFDLYAWKCTVSYRRERGRILSAHVNFPMTFHSSFTAHITSYHSLLWHCRLTDMQRSSRIITNNKPTHKTFTGPMSLLSLDQLCQSAVFTDRVVWNQPRRHYIYLLTYCTLAYLHIISFIIDFYALLFHCFFLFFF